MPVIAFFLIKSLHGKVQPNWAMTGYITGIIAFARYYFSEGRRQKTEDRQKNPVRKRLSNGVLITAIGLAMVVTIISHYPMIINLPLKLDPSSRLRGWKELGTEVSRIYDSISDKGQVLIFSDRYQVSSELAFYVKGHPETYCINLGRRMNQYDIWPDMPKTQNLKRINGIFVRIGNTDMPLQVADSFERYEKKILQVYDRGRLLREYSIFICYNFKGLKIVKPQTY
jgi:undecaprenyl-diphosphatase